MRQCPSSESVTAIGTVFEFSLTTVPTRSFRCLSVNPTVSPMKNSSGVGAVGALPFELELQ